MRTDVAKFAAHIIKRYAWDHDVDGGDVQEHAIKYGLIRQIEFNPDIHDDDGYGLEKGDPWLEFTPEFKQMLMGTK